MTDACLACGGASWDQLGPGARDQVPCRVCRGSGVGGERAMRIDRAITAAHEAQREDGSRQITPWRYDGEGRLAAVYERQDGVREMVHAYTEGE